MMGKHTTDMLTSRFASKFSLDNMVLAGSGISHDALKAIGANVEGLSSGEYLFFFFFVV